MRFYLILAVYAMGLIAANAQIAINLSRDLVRLGIASQNLAPDTPSLDARPFFQATLQYVASHPVRLLTVDPGHYYFLTPENATAYLSFPSLSHLTVDLAGSTIYFQGAFLQGFSLSNCDQVTLTRFKFDFLSPPYTYVQLAAVNATARTLAYTLLPGWPDPASLTAPSGVSVALYAVVFRNDRIVPGTSRMLVAPAIANQTLTLVQDNTPWTQSTTLATLQPGDIMVVTQRGGSPVVQVIGGKNITISDGTFYGGGAIALLLNTVADSTVEGVRVMPREGNFTASNADGIHFVDCGPNNHIQNCYVAGTLDDALVFDSLVLATLPAATPAGATTLTVTRKANSRFPNRTRVNFVDPNTDQELTGATIIAQNPPETSTPVFGGPVTLTFDRALPALALGSGMVYAAPAQRGAGSSIENNKVGETPFGRGIWIAGTEGISVHDNTVGRTSNAGIAVFQDTSLTSYPLPPAHDIEIAHNLVTGSLGPMASGSGTEIALGGIMVDSVNTSNAFPTGAPNTNILIHDNCVLSSGRAGLWISQLTGGTIRDNGIIRYNLYPKLPFYGVSPQESAQLPLDFAHGIFTQDDQNLALFNNFVFQQ